MNLWVCGPLFLQWIYHLPYSFFGLNLQTFDYFLLIKQMECQAGVCVGLGRGRVGGEGVGGQTFIDDTVGNFFHI